MSSNLVKTQYKLIYQHLYQKIHLKEVIINIKHLHELKIFNTSNCIMDLIKEGYYKLL